MGVAPFGRAMSLPLGVKQKTWSWNSSSLVCSRNFSESFLDQFQAECQAYADDFGIPYLDYSRDDRFAHTSKYFVDTDHLSPDGSEAFMDLFFDDLKAFYPED